MPSVPDARFEAIGHRGAPTQRPENTLDGFLLSIDQGADAVELDVHVSGDGIAVVHHDPEVSSAAIRSTPWLELRALAAAKGVDLPRLNDVLDAIGDAATVYVELKGEQVEPVVVEVVRRHGHRYAFHSFDHAAMARVAERAPDIPRGVLLDSGTTNPIQAMRRLVDRVAPRDVWPHWSLVSDDMLRAARELDVRILVWTVNSADTARRMVSLGVAGICTDDVRTLVNL